MSGPRALVGCLVAALATVAVAASAGSGAAFTAASTSPESRVTADTLTNWLHLWSQGSDPAGLTGYGVRASTASEPAARGSDTGLSVKAGGWKNATGPMLRAFTLEAPGTLPAGPITVTLTAVPAAGGETVVQTPLAAPVGSSGGAASVTLTAGQKRQVNLTIDGKRLPGKNNVYTGGVQVQVTYPGFSGSFLTFTVPVEVYDGVGAGP